MSSFGEILSELRKDKSLSQKALADVLHVSSGTISNYENGVHLPDIEKLMEIASFFQVTTDYLLGRCDSNLSPDVFQESLGPGGNIGSFISAIQRLPSDRRDAIWLILSDMVFRAAIGQYSEGEH